MTPALTGTLLPGVTRDTLLTLAGDLGYQAEEGKISTDEWREGNASGAITEVFDLRPAAFRRYLDLHRPIFQKTAAYGHFGREDADFTWERADRVDELRARLQIRADVTILDPQTLPRTTYKTPLLHVRQME